MTVLRHRLLDAANQPIAGRTATVLEYTAPSGRGYRRVKTNVAVSDNDGWLAWLLPPPSRTAARLTTDYVVNGIEAHPVLITVPNSVSTVTVAETRFGTIAEQASNAIDLVTEVELTVRLAGISAQMTPPTTDAEKEAFVPGRLSAEQIAAIQGTPDPDPDTGVRRDAFGGFTTDYIHLVDTPSSPTHATPLAFVENAVAGLVPFWKPSETVTAGAVRMSALGLTLKRISAGTTRASYDATEAALWTVTGGGGGGAVDSVNGEVGPVVLDAADVGAVPIADAVELAVATSETLTAAPVVSGLAADAGHVHRLPNVDANGHIILHTADGTPVKLLVVNGIVGAGGGGGAPAVAPEQVTGLTAGTATEDSVPLSWTAPAAGDQPITDYIVQFRVTGAPSWDTFTDGTGNTTSTTVTALTASTGYDFRVAAMSSVGTGPWSDTVPVSTTAAPVEEEPPVEEAFTDDFNRADGPLGNGWTLDSQDGNKPNLEIISNQAGKIGGGFTFAWAVRDCGSADGDIEVTTTDAQNGLVVRYADRLNWIALYEGNIWQMVAGDRTKLVTPLDFSTVGTIKLVMSGDTLTAYRDGALVAEATSTFNQSVTTHGIVRFVESGTLDNFTFTPAAAPTPVTDFSDDFNRADGPVGNGWELVSLGNTEDVTIIGNQAAGAVTFPDGESGIVRDLGAANGTITVEMANTDSDRGFLLFRYVDTQNHWRLGNGMLEKVVGGVHTEVGTAGLPTTLKNTVVMDGDHLYVVTRDGQFTFFDGNDTTHAGATKAGFALRRTGRADNFTFTPSAVPVAFSDDFERADGPVGNGWTVESASLTIASGKAVWDNGGQGLMTRDVGAADGTWEYAGDQTDFLVRYVDNMNYIRVDGNHLYAVVDGVATEIGSAVTAEEGFMVVTSGTAVDLFDVNGVRVAGGTTTAHQNATMVGFKIGDTIGYVDYFSFTPATP